MQKNKYQFTINNHIFERSVSYTYRGITIKASGSVNKAVNVLKEEASRALPVIKHNVKKPLWNTGKKKPEAKRDYNVIWP